MTTLMKLLVALGLDAGEYTKGLEDAEDQASTSAGKIQSSLASIGGTVVKGAVAAAGAGIAALTGITVKSVDSTTEWAETLDGVGDVLGTTAQESAAMAVAIQGVGGDVGTMTSQMATLTRGLLDAKGELGPTGKVLDSLGISFRDANGQIKPANSILADVATKINAMPDGLKKTALMTDLFGKSGKDLSDVMGALADGGLDRAGKKAADLGLAMSDEAVSGAIELGRTTETLKMGFQGFLVQIGTGLLPLLNQLGGLLTTALADPTVQSGIQSLASGVADFAGQVITNIPVAITTFQNIVTWLTQNQGVIVGILAALGVAVGVFVYTTVIPAVVAAVTAAAPVIAIMAAIGVAAYLLYQAWTNNFGGIRDIVTSIWEDKLQPAFSVMSTWLQTNLPVAINWLTAAWQNTLLPAIQSVWSWMSGTLFPFLESLSNFVSAVFGLAWRVLAGVFTELILPALKDVSTWVGEHVMPVLKDVANWVGEHVTPAFNGLSETIGKVTDWFRQLADKINNLSLPSWLTPGSPTPLEMGLVGINRAMGTINNSTLPTFSANLQLQPVGIPNLSADVTSSRQAAAAAAPQSIGGLDQLKSAIDRLPFTIRDAILQTQG